VTGKDFEALVLLEGIAGPKLELIDGRPLFNLRYELCLSPEQARVALAAGIDVSGYTAVDAVLADPQARAEVARRLSGAA
jgi:hypothetical protein